MKRIKTPEDIESFGYQISESFIEIPENLCFTIFLLEQDYDSLFKEVSIPKEIKTVTDRSYLKYRSISGVDFIIKKK